MLRLLTTVFLLVLAIGVVAWPDLARALAGHRPLAVPSVAEIDEPPGADEREAPRFFMERNVVSMTVRRETTLGELVRLYQIDFPHVRRQIARQAGLADSADSQVLRAGQRLEIALTPPDESAP